VIGTLISFIRSMRDQRRMYARVAAALPRHEGEIVEQDGLRVDLGALGKALAARGFTSHVEALLADPPAHIPRAVRDIARTNVRVGGLLDFACPVCGMRYPGNQLVLHREENFPLSSTEGRCPAGHPLPGLPSETVIQ
jgi:hypothetical protein